MGPELTPRELDVVKAIRGGARSLSEIARALDPPVSWRTAEAHVTSINRKLTADFEPKLTPLWRVLMWATRSLPSGLSE